MKKKKAKYGLDPIIDNRTAAQKLAWETSPSPIVKNPNAVSPMAYDPSQADRLSPSFLPDQYYTSKTEEQGTGVYDLHPAFYAVNTLALATNGIADAINNGKTSREEKLKYIQSLQNRFHENNPVLNDQPMYMAAGGEKKGKQPIITNNPHDPRLKAYNDSLSLYNGSTRDREKMNKIFDFTKSDNKMWSESDVLKEIDKNQYFKDNRNFLYGKFDLQQGITDGKPWAMGQYENQDYAEDYAKNKLHLKNRPIGWVQQGDSPHWNGIYKKPVQPVLYEKPVVGHKNVDASIVPQPNVRGYNQMDAQGQPLQSNLGKATPYSFTWMDNNSPNQQLSQYFDNVDQWRSFIKDNPNFDIQGSEEGKDYATARGYKKMAIGGDTEMDTIPSYLYYIKAIQSGNKAAADLAEKHIRDVRGDETARGMQFLGKSLASSSIHDVAKRSVNIETNPQLKHLYATINENPDIIDKYDYQMPENKDLAFRKPKMPYGGGPLTAAGAKEMLKDGTAHGKKLTDKQKRYFGYIAGGGKPKAKYGVDEPEAVDNGQEERVEAEGGEVYTNQDQNVIKIPDTYPSHEQGGVPLNDVNRVLENTSTTRKDMISKSLKISPDMFKEMFGINIKKPLSHADALEKAYAHYQKQGKKVENGLKKGADILERNKNDYYAQNSTDLNIKTAQAIPSKNHVFDLLFQHQEHVKDMLGVQEPQQAKYGKYIAAIGIGDDITPYPGGKTKQGATTPTGQNNAFKKNKDAYKAIWKQLGIDPDAMTNSEFQSAAYDYILKNNPEVARNMWKQYGNTAKGIKNKIGKNFDFSNLTDEQLNKLKPAYVDGLVGVRTLEATLPPAKPDTPPAQQPAPPDAPAPPVIPTNVPFNLRKTGSPSRFNEPLRWYDVAGPLMSLTESERTPANYNPLELNEVHLKQQNPTPALEAGNRDYNALLNELPNSGAGMANATNAFSSKYSIDNQILGNYENVNSQIKNQETMYNAGVRDRQSAADQQSRAVFEQQVLGSKEAQRQQKLTAFDDLFTRVALNRKLNREGNLIMQMSPNFNQYAQYNGNQRYFTPTSSNDTDGNGISYITDPKTGKQYPILRQNGKLENKSKILSGLSK